MGHKRKGKSSGRRRPTAVPQSRYGLPVDRVIAVCSLIIGIAGLVMPMNNIWRTSLCAIEAGLLVLLIWHLKATWLAPALKVAMYICAVTLPATVAWTTWQIPPVLIEVSPAGPFLLCDVNSVTPTKIMVRNKIDSPLYSVIVEIRTEPPSGPPELEVRVVDDPNAVITDLAGLQVSMDVFPMVIAPPTRGFQFVFTSGIAPGQVRYIHAVCNTHVRTYGFARVIESHTSPL